MKIKCIAKRPDSGFYVTVISNNLKNLQKFVGGYIETASFCIDTPDNKFVIICNEEGKIRNLPYNCTIFGEDFVGDILIVGTDGEEFVELTDEQIKTVKPLLDNLRPMK